MMLYWLFSQAWTIDPFGPWGILSECSWAAGVEWTVAYPVDWSPIP